VAVACPRLMLVILALALLALAPVEEAHLLVTALNAWVRPLTVTSWTRQLMAT